MPLAVTCNIFVTLGYICKNVWMRSHTHWLIFKLKILNTKYTMIDSDEVIAENWAGGEQMYFCT